ncbi:MULTISPECIES: glycosyltransferase family 4 protein [unclassified Shinella]|uniref:glycosyltransferase family 4 protein n=1 Tax=unclassified Shinella TaxID=2643062 RepID=UPI00234E77EE|nr:MULTISPECIES: glycosyltransferase family 4 protein [unclassified Shinella]MCO5151617.1 glycosyltransferase family 4 protein [Shinella sp.]MDC7266376.1 glycosyltransferase family 4 protein [Shinella sp. HY16]MDC7273273.1 glycosyltransferase family 4 protein [Shinella sp. YZ44]
MNETIVVSQLGARMHYAVPRILAREGQLGHFFTDICGTKSWPALLRKLPPGLLPRAVRRLTGRVPSGVPAELITDFPLFGLRSGLRRLRVENDIEEISHAVWAGSHFSTLVASRGFHDAAGLYAYSGDALEQMQAAKRLGMWTAVEQMVAPRTVLEAILAEEMLHFPDWAGPPKQNPFADTLAERERAEWRIADCIVCPSGFVRDHVVAEGGPAERCVVVPYGVDAEERYGPAGRTPGPLRVLTVGEVGLRKGSPYVLQAAERLGAAARIRMVGPDRLPPYIRRRMGRSVELRGIVPRQQIAAEYHWADVFLLPSLCEGSATVVYEALASGLPVVTTYSTGSVVRDGVEGLIVPERDPQAIADAIRHLADNEDIRASMSQNARRTARDNTVEKYGRRLLDVLTRLHVRHGVVP